MNYNLKHIPYVTLSKDDGGQSQEFPWLTGTPYLDMTAAQFNGTTNLLGGAQLGDIFWSRGNAFRFVKADAGLTIGQLVTTATPTTGTFTAAGSTAATLITNINNAATVAVNGDVDNWIFAINANATLNTLRRIKGNTSSATASYTISKPNYQLPTLPNDADALTVATLPANGAAVSIIRPHHVIVNTATTAPVGVALGTVTQYNYTLIQVAGLAILSAVGNGGGTTALKVNQPAIGGAAGVILGDTAGALNYMGGATVIPLHATSAATEFIPCLVNFIGA